MSSARRTMPLFLALALGLVPAGPAAAAERDALSDARDRLEVEAQRVEKRFTEGRAAAYKMVRSTPARYVEAVEEVQTLLAMLRADTSLKPARRKQLIVTLEWDLGNFRTILADRRRADTRSDDLPRAVRRDVRRADEERVGRRDVTREAERVLASRGRAVADLRGTRTRSAERFTRAAGSVEESAVPESRDYTLPKNWAELSKRRSPEAKLTAKEKAVLEALDKVITAEFKEARFSEVIEYLEKLTGQSILVDKRALEEAGVTYDSTVTLPRLRATTRSVLKRILADLNLAYVIKDEQIEITSQARAREMTTTRVYYLGDLAAVVDVRIDPITSQLLMMERVQQIIKLITTNVDPQSWKVNNPDAPGKIVFDPVRMVLVVQQTAEVHYELGKSFRR